jgi:hypothetical protein
MQFELPTQHAFRSPYPNLAGGSGAGGEAGRAPPPGRSMMSRESREPWWRMAPQRRSSESTAERTTSRDRRSTWIRVLCSYLRNCRDGTVVSNLKRPFLIV